ncbi:MAG: KOW domain-containing RNA-binding protein [Clostridia bacterium]|nr:KOW domain-containing RNA-binding protein [Clostridia bacterium]
MVRGQIVISTAGHDKGEMLVIAGFDKNRVLVCDGKQRKLSKLKAKNPKHLKETDILLNEDSIATDRKIRKTLNKTANPGG